VKVNGAASGLAQSLAVAVALSAAVGALAGCERDRADLRQGVVAAGAAVVPDAASDGAPARATDAALPRAVCEGAGVTLPERGSPVRHAVVEVVRAHLAMRQDLKIDRLVVAGDWAYLQGAEQIENGRHVAGLVRRQRGAWTVVQVLTAPASDDVHPLRERLRTDARRPPPQLFGAD
jgi:hypothetical protein